MMSTTIGPNKAPKWRRLLATFIDLGLFLLISTILLLVSGVLEHAAAWELHQLIPRTAGLIFVSYLVTHGYALYRWGHTIGKQWLKLQITTNQSTPPAFWQLLWLRGPFLPMLLLLLAWPLSPLLVLLPLIDSLLIFSRSGRCLHDRIAGTVVVQTTSGTAR